MDDVVATYLIESFLPPEEAADMIANEQSTGTFIPLPGETAELRDRFRARVVEVAEVAPGERPPLPGTMGAGRADGPALRAKVRVAFPLHNFGPSLPNLLAAVAGNLFELRQLAAVRLVDLDLPAAFAERYPGPQHGVVGTRRLLDRPDGVLIGTIIKPSIGLSLDALRALVRELASAGLDFIKDDELAGNPPYAPFEQRVSVVMDELKRVADRTGRMPMYAFNISDDIDRMERNHDLVVGAGGTCVMVCVNTVGYAGLAHLRRRAVLPIHGHRAMVGAMTRSPQLGVDFAVFQKLARLAGADHLHTNGLGNKFYETDDEVLAAIAAVRTPLLGGYETLPVLSSGQWAGQAHRTYELTGTTDLLVLAGGGIHAHPDGPTAGAEAMRTAWTAATEGVTLSEAAASSRSLRRAIQTFG